MENQAENKPKIISRRITYILALALIGVAVASFFIINNQSSQLTIVKGQLSNATIQNNQLNASSKNPTLALWKANKTLAPNQYSVGTLPDAFNNHFSLKASQAFHIYIMTYANFALYQTSQQSAFIVEYLSNSTNETSFYFNETSGCDGYLMLIIPNNENISTLLEPNLTSKYSPSLVPTGVCTP